MMSDQSPSVLVIEDNPGDFALVREFLLEQADQPEVFRAATFNEARTILSNKSNPFDIILLDLSLPDQTGIPLIQDIIKMSGNSPVIVLTGYSDLTFGVKSLGLGVADYILKDELSATLLYKSMVYSRERKRISSALEISEKQALNFARQLNQAIEDERLRIAREIHDEFGQQLSGLKMSLAALQKDPGITSETVPLITTIIEEVDQSIKSLRQIANQLRPVLLDKLGLFTAIEWLASDFEHKSGITTELYVALEQPELTKVQEIHIFRICQEALTNITKHAGADQVSIRVENQAGGLSINIRDNGKGLPSGQPEDQLSMGLLNMRERANLVGAELIIDSPPGEGTRIELMMNPNG